MTILKCTIIGIAIVLSSSSHAGVSDEYILFGIGKECSPPGRPGTSIAPLSVNIKNIVAQSRKDDQSVENSGVGITVNEGTMSSVVVGQPIPYYIVGEVDTPSKPFSIVSLIEKSISVSVDSPIVSEALSGNTVLAKNVLLNMEIKDIQHIEKNLKTIISNRVISKDECIVLPLKPDVKIVDGIPVAAIDELVFDEIIGRWDVTYKKDDYLNSVRFIRRVRSSFDIISLGEMLRDPEDDKHAFLVPVKLDRNFDSKYAHSLNVIREKVIISLRKSDPSILSWDTESIGWQYTYNNELQQIPVASTSIVGERNKIYVELYCSNICILLITDDAVNKAKGIHIQIH